MQKQNNKKNQVNRFKKEINLKEQALKEEEEKMKEIHVWVDLNKIVE